MFSFHRLNLHTSHDFYEFGSLSLSLPSLKKVDLKQKSSSCFQLSFENFGPQRAQITESLNHDIGREIT